MRYMIKKIEVFLSIFPLIICLETHLSLTCVFYFLLLSGVSVSASSASPLPLLLSWPLPLGLLSDGGRLQRSPAVRSPADFLQHMDAFPSKKTPARWDHTCECAQTPPLPRMSTTSSNLVRLKKAGAPWCHFSSSLVVISVSEKRRNLPYEDSVVWGSKVLSHNLRLLKARQEWWYTLVILPHALKLSAIE